MRRRFPSPHRWWWLLLAASGVLAADDPAFEWRYRIEGGLVSGRVYRIALSEDVFAHSRFFPADLEVRDAAGRVWPSSLYRPDTAPVDTVVRSRFQVQAADGDAPARIEITFPRFRSQPQPMHNRVMIDWATGPDGLHPATVFGGEHRNGLVRLGGGFLVRQRDPVRVANRMLEYPDSTARVLAVDVGADARTGEHFPDPVSVEVYARHPASDTNRVLAMTPVLAKRSDTRSGTLSLVYDLGASNLPVSRFGFELSTRVGAVPVNLSGAGSTNGPWREVADGILQAAPESGPATIEVSWPGYRFLKVDLIHFDLGDLRVSGAHAEWLPHYLAVEAVSDGPAYLYTGSPTYVLPNQALRTRLSEGDIRAAPERILGRRTPNPDRMADRLQAYRVTLLGVLALLLLLLYALVVMKRLRGRMA